MSESEGIRRYEAIHDFRRARWQATIQQIIARLTGQPIDLLSFDEVQQKFRLTGRASRGLQEIPLTAIVGSVGRYSDFTRSFFPRHDSDEMRWAQVETAVTSLEGVPPIEVYQVGQVYFVLDGNHRVSVARQMGLTFIEAYVTEFKTNVPLSPEDDVDDLIIKAEYADFLQRTRLDKIQSATNLRVTVPGRYRELETHLEAHHYLKQQALEMTYDEAVADWHQHIYLPLIEVIREKGILRDFPGRTETDLYLWIYKHRSKVSQQLGWHIDPKAALTNLVTEYSRYPSRVVARLEEKLVKALTLDEFEGGPAPGTWRTEWLTSRPDDRLFANILVPLSGEPDGWPAFEQAVELTRHQEGQIYGLHVVDSVDQVESDIVRAIQVEFDRRCQEADVPGYLRIEAGKVTRTIIERARWSDLIVIHLVHPPPAQPLAKLGSKLHTIIHRSPRPILLVPGPAQPLKRALLAYDASPKAREGLFVAAYLAGRWQIHLTVTTIIEQDSDQEKLRQAQQYLEAKGITATYIPNRVGPADVATSLLQIAQGHQIDLIIMGGYGFKPMLEVVLGSTVDAMLQRSGRPILICR